MLTWVVGEFKLPKKGTSKTIYMKSQVFNPLGNQAKEVRKTKIKTNFQCEFYWKTATTGPIIMQILLVPLQFVNTPNSILVHIMQWSLKRSFFFFTAYKHGSLSLISVVFINPISCSHSSLPQASCVDANIRPPSPSPRPASIQHHCDNDWVERLYHALILIYNSPESMFALSGVNAHI